MRNETIDEVDQSRIPVVEDDLCLANRCRRIQVGNSIMDNNYDMLLNSYVTKTQHLSQLRKPDIQGKRRLFCLPRVGCNRERAKEEVELED